MQASVLLRWGVALLFGFFGLWVICLNFKIVYVWLARREHHSWVPLVGGFFAFVGMGLCPLPQVQKLAWIPLSMDVCYCVSMLVVGLVMACIAKRGRDDA